ncbi:hypothetical protein [Psychrobacter frigidicola]|nr:hypothetical protein [Psychrobacter frigidicola]
MFHFLTPTPDTVSRNTATIHRKTRSDLWHESTVLAFLLAATLLISACQQQTDTTAEGTISQTTEQQRVEDNKPALQSESAAAHIAQFQPLYVTQMQGLQRRMQAEYESLQAADTADSDNVLPAINPDASTSVINSKSETQTTTARSVAPDNSATAETVIDTDNATTDNSASANTADNAEINVSTEVGERDLNVLKSLSLEVHEPKLFTEDQIIKNYQQAIEALYQPAADALSAKEADTLLNIATLVPQLFEHPEIAERLTIKSPALGRLIIQYQVWQQIEVQQALDMQQMERTQQQEFESLLAKFNDTIKGYDEQIAKYEQTLKEYQ